jgi:hypothetical protein
MEENVHFVPIEKNNKDWKKYIPSWLNSSFL